MPWRPHWPEPGPTPPRLATYDDTIGRLSHNGEPVGFVSFRLVRRYNQTGHLWWKGFSNLHDVIQWMEWIHPDTEDDVIDDGEYPATQQDELYLGVWETSRWKLTPDVEMDPDEAGQPVRLRLDFLAGEERDSEWRTHGWGVE